MLSFDLFWIPWELRFLPAHNLFPLYIMSNWDTERPAASLMYWYRTLVSRNNPILMRNGFVLTSRGKQTVRITGFSSNPYRNRMPCLVIHNELKRGKKSSLPQRLKSTFLKKNLSGGPVRKGTRSEEKFQKNILILLSELWLSCVSEVIVQPPKHM